jgi:hypothetical protein
MDKGEPGQTGPVLNAPTFRTAGSVIVAEAVAVAFKLSVTVTVYVPGAKPVAVILVCEDGSLHLYKYGLVPPFAEMVAVPLLKPAQLTSFLEEIVAVSVVAID